MTIFRRRARKKRYGQLKMLVTVQLKLKLRKIIWSFLRGAGQNFPENLRTRFFKETWSGICTLNLFRKFRKLQIARAKEVLSFSVQARKRSSVCSVGGNQHLPFWTSVDMAYQQTPVSSTLVNIWWI